MHCCSSVLGEFAVDGWGIRLAREGQRGTVTISEGTNATYVTCLGLLYSISEIVKSDLIKQGV